MQGFVPFCCWEVLRICRGSASVADVVPVQVQKARWASGVVEVVKYLLCQHVLEVVVWVVHFTQPVYRVQLIGLLVFHLLDPSAPFIYGLVWNRWIARVHMHATSTRLGIGM